jgi:D-alanyl-D-alanine carboxypeptidase/D-alanyl-D-alanine-endopeptidase (penicillin-binding protein 4)
MAGCILERDPAATAPFDLPIGYTSSMRVAVATLAVLVALAGAPGALGAGRTGGGGAVGQGGGSPAPAPGGASSRAVASLKRSLNAGMRQAGPYSGADVVDLTANRELFSHNATTPRLPASVEKLYTTTTALTRFGANANLSTTVLGSGQQRGSTFDGTLYLRGGGDPTFGSAGFDSRAYGTGATMQHLVSNLVSVTGIKQLDGSVVADESVFDADRGTPATGEQPSIEVEGELSGLAYNRGWANSDGSAFVLHPALEAGQQFVAALQAAGVKVPRRTRVTAGVTPQAAHTLASAGSPRIATLISLTNTPSDNFFAEMLCKDLGARFGGAGTTAAGAAVIRAQVAKSFGIHPQLNDGSGLSRADRTSPAQVVTLLRDERSNTAFTSSLAVAGQTGTLENELNGTYAEGRCRGKTGTLHDASNVVGYCRAQDGHTLAYAFLMNGIFPDYAHPIQDRMELAVARYGG